MSFPVFENDDVEAFAALYFKKGSTQDQLYSLLAPIVERFSELQGDEQKDFRGQVREFVRQYSFLAQVITFLDGDLEKLYVFTRHLRRLLKVDRLELPVEIQQNIDMESYRIQQTGSGESHWNETGQSSTLCGPRRLFTVPQKNWKPFP